MELQPEKDYKIDFEILPPKLNFAYVGMLKALDRGGVNLKKFRKALALSLAFEWFSTQRTLAYGEYRDFDAAEAPDVRCGGQNVGYRAATHWKDSRGSDFRCDNNIIARRNATVISLSMG